MKKRFLKLAFVAGAAMTLFSACSSDKVKEFGLEVAQAINSGDTAKVYSLFSFAKEYGGLVSNVNMDSISVEKLDSINYRISYGSTAGLHVSDVNDSLRILETYGLGTFDPDQFAFYKGIGAKYKPLGFLTDGMFVNCTRMDNLTNFIASIADSIISEGLSVESIEKKKINWSQRNTGCFLQLKNNLPQDFDPNDFTVEAELQMNAMAEGFDEALGEFTDKPQVQYTYKTTRPVAITEVIPQGGEMKVEVSYPLQAKPESEIWNEPKSAKLKLTPKIPQNEFLVKYYKPQGNEYDLFVNRIRL